MDNLEVLVPAVKLVFVQVEVHRAWDQLFEDARCAQIRDVHVFKRDIPAVRDISAPVVGLFETYHLNLDGPAFTRVHILLHLELLLHILSLLISHQMLWFVS